MSGVFNIDNSIISGNTTSSFLDCAGNLNGSSARNSVFGDNSQNRGCGFGTASNNVTVQGDISTVFETSAGIPVLANNGGNTQTVALVAGSPAINAGDNNLLPADVLDTDGDNNTAETIDIDQAGRVRIILNRVDAGAYEGGACASYSFPYTVGTLQSNLQEDLRQAINCAEANGVPDVINLADDIEMTTRANDQSAFQQIDTTITINGNGSTLARNLDRSCGGAGLPFRFFKSG